jgi:hypothetical protein
MKRNWKLEIVPDPANSSSYRFILAISKLEGSEGVELIASEGAFEVFQKEVALVKEELNELLQRAQERMRDLQEESSPFLPEQVWQTMEAFPTEEEMMEQFNAFSESQRQQIAEYVLTHVSMFKGRGPVFAEKYDMESHTLG